jgi:hypothetical protein
MRKFILTGIAVLRFAAIGLMLTGPTFAQMAHTGSAYLNRAQCILAANWPRRVLV